jgi:hypothetical protein
MRVPRLSQEPQNVAALRIVTVRLAAASAARHERRGARTSSSRLLPQLMERVAASRDERRVIVLVPTGERGQRVEGT